MGMGMGMGMGVYCICMRACMIYVSKYVDGRDVGTGMGWGGGCLFS